MDPFELIEYDPPEDGEEEEAEESDADPDGDDDLFPGSSEESQSDDNDHNSDSVEGGNEGGQNETMDFDVELATRHAYLGDSVPVPGRVIYGDDECPTEELPLLPMSGLVLMPEQIMPLALFRSNEVSLIRTLLDTTKTFGSVCSSLFSRQHHQGDILGTTAEIFEYREPENDYEVGLKVKIRGRQRFKILSTRQQVDGIMLAKVKILSEIALGELMNPVRLRSRDKLRNDVRSRALAIDKSESDCSGDESSALRRRFSQFMSKLRPRRSSNEPEDESGTQFDVPSSEYSSRLAFSQNHVLSAWPKWVHDMYDERILVTRLTDILRGPAFVNIHHVNLPLTATELSFWVATNLPFEERDRVALLGINSAIQRLRFEISLVQMIQSLCCKFCLQEIGSRENMISMTQEGLQGTYVNPGGAVHETLTLSKVNRGAVRLEGNSSTQFSWFPGYAWTIAQCARCLSHLGWKFTSTNRKLSPRKFWGITKASIIPIYKSPETSENIVVM
ncbi:hypothetical protein TCAL_01597 [Tigriopus californicus]|uniref:Protein cereblon n=1 Tax=Tigriopus californicus TaxID=6832 RepID=A0A553PBX6_TIGCA|nr:protein cereblon-like [Tigriopus californicus]TRY75187.1 hypothetical protein TCAL_01597 [Tigriopus californicus]